MSAANPRLYTVRNGASSLPSTLAAAMTWQYFWWEVQGCGPADAVRWRITRNQQNELSITSLPDLEEDIFGYLRDPFLVQQGDNLVVLHIDEKELQTDS